MSVGERCEHADVRYFADEKRAIACMNCGRLFGHLDVQERMLPHNPRGAVAAVERMRGGA